MKSRMVLAGCILLLFVSALPAATTVFTGTVSEFWSNPDNWSNGFPQPADKFRIGAELCILDTDGGVAQNGVWEGGTIGTLRLVDGALLSVSQWSIIGYPSGGDADNRYTLEVLGGVYNGGIPERPNDGRIFVGRQGFAKLVIDYSGRVNLLHQDMQVGQSDGGDGVVEIRGGILDCGTRRIRLATSANATAHLDFSGGVLKQPATQGNLDEINGWIESGMITAYDGVGTVVITETETGDMLVTGLHPMNPVPGDGANIVPGSLTLEWTVDAGTPVDVWVGTKADLSDFSQVVEKQTVSSVQIDAVKGTRYFWAVDTYVAGAEEPTLGPVFDFYVDNLPPEVVASDDVTTWLVDGTVEVAIAATVTDLDPTTVAWSVVSEPEAGAAVIAAADQTETSVTLSALGTYVLQLEADDGEFQGADTVTINVFADSCEAAQSLPDYVALVGDLDGDCDVDQDDMDLLMANWLECVALGECDPVQ